MGVGRLCKREDRFFTNRYGRVRMELQKLRQMKQKRALWDATMLRANNLAGLIELMVDRAGAQLLGDHPNEGRTGGCSGSTELPHRRHHQH